MIVKKVASKNQSSYLALGGYLLDRDNDFNVGKKVASYRFDNCNFEQDDMQSNIKEILNTQSLNTRAKGDKTLHLIVSFNENERPDETIIYQIIDELCQSLKMGDHQRLSVIHDNTNNLHAHIAINRIHPQTLKIANPKNDVLILQDKAVELEKKFNLMQERHHSKKNEFDIDLLQLKIEEKESQAYLPHFQSGLENWLKVKAFDEINAVLKSEQCTFSDIQSVLSKYNVNFRERRRGFVIQSDTSPFFIKASKFHRELSKNALEKRFGTIQLEIPNKKHNPLWNEYLTTINANKEQKQKQLDLLYKQIKIYRKYKQLQKLKEKLEEVKSVRVKYRHQNFKEFLIKKGFDGDQEAINLFRRSKPKPNENDNVIRGTKIESNYKILENPNYVTKQGYFIYADKTKSNKIVDKGEFLKCNINSNDDRLILKMLEFAMQKYGQNLSIKGDDKFKKRLIEVADKYQLKCNFLDEKMLSLYNKPIEEHIKDCLSTKIIEKIDLSIQELTVTKDIQESDSLKKKIKSMDKVYLKLSKNQAIFENDLLNFLDEKDIKNLDMIDSRVKKQVFKVNETNKEGIYILNRLILNEMDEGIQKEKFKSFMYLVDKGRIDTITLDFYRFNGIENLQSFCDSYNMQITDVVERELTLDYTQHNFQYLKNSLKQDMQPQQKQKIVENIENFRKQQESSSTYQTKEALKDILLVSMYKCLKRSKQVDLQEKNRLEKIAIQLHKTYSKTFSKNYLFETEIRRFLDDSILSELDLTMFEKFSKKAFTVQDNFKAINAINNYILDRMDEGEEKRRFKSFMYLVDKGRIDTITLDFYAKRVDIDSFIKEYDMKTIKIIQTAKVLDFSRNKIFAKEKLNATQKERVLEAINQMKKPVENRKTIENSNGMEI
ncbi:hypothetical protein CCZ01_09465 [Helicobacter monodelphidis]|uniref:TraI/MobA(P) family conjugative relaxase n=1 Tax=Helicobacter sp. 15-1451 TaxID=2004995 RepID=UPI000DCBFFA0|nr:TraI/MobA(P) family conjugative relaxase [Helicobacter sp. 15-1451]RAX56455.1 hypothetical protein CCZ01_09465 [Helicobacter sp. 15-1451]